MNQEKYIGMDVHQAHHLGCRDGCCRQANHGMLAGDQGGHVVEYIRGLRGTLALTLEEATSAAWLHDLLKPHVAGSWSATREGTLF